MAIGFQFEKMKKFGRWIVVMVAQSVNVLNAPELYTKNG